MPQVLSYADAVRLLGGQRSRFVETFDRLTGGVLLAASVPLPALLGIFDAKAEFVRLGHDLVRSASERRSGLSRYGRTQRLEAAHAVLAVTAYFEVLARAELPFAFADLAVDAGEQLTFAGAYAPDPRMLTDALFGTVAPVPGPHLPYPRYRAALVDFYGTLGLRLGNFVRGLAAWERLDRAGQRAFAALLDSAPERAADRHRDLLTQFAAEFPEVRFWLGLHEHEATRGELRSLAAGLVELRAALDAISTGRAPDERRAALARAYATELDQPIVASGEVPAGLRVPTLGAAYVPPLCRIVALAPADRPSDEAWWDRQPLRDDLWQSLLVHLTSPGATVAPLLVLGQPGSGKSLLTRILAAQLPAADFMVVRVTLRHVYAAADLQEQIEQAVRYDTGERVDWPALSRSAGDALPVVLLDGFDELLQATGVAQTDYLRRVAAFQRREADQGRPVAVLVTSRTSVADRAQPPAGTVAVRLEPFDDARVAAWVDTWNMVNAGPFAALGVQRLDPATVLAHRELAGQPLLLLMLALYDAEGNDLRSAGDLRRGELYERLLRRFARREVVKHRAGLSARDLDRAVEEELRRLSVVAFAMFNRRAQAVTDTDLEADLAALKVGAPASAVDRSGLRTPLRAAEVVLGRFFFIHRSRATLDDTRHESYEFLHATFGEYLVARFTTQVLADLVARDTASSLSLGGDPVDDDLLHALLSYAVLTSRAPVLAFLAEHTATLDEQRRADWADLLLRLFRAAPYATGGRRFDGYRPMLLPVPARHAAYTANLLLLAVCAAGEVTAGQLFPDVTDVVGRWRGQALLWRSQLDDEEWASLVNALALDRRVTGHGRDVALSRDDGGFTPPPVDMPWAHGLRPVADVDVLFYQVPDQETWFRRRTHFECDVDDDTVRHTLEPIVDYLPDSTSLFVRPWADALPSAARLLLDAWLLPYFHGVAPEEQARAYRRCARVAVTVENQWGSLPYTYPLLLLDRLAGDREVPAELAFEILMACTDVVVDRGSGTTAALRCIVALLGRDRTVDVKLYMMTDELLALSRRGEYVDWLDDLFADVLVRLYELELGRVPLSAAEAESFRRRYGDRRPDLVQRLRPLVDGPADGRE
ncbi:NACHT domain-containing protein [Micromonospora echinofusca]|uniref:AAA+ ATPase domain-containing protein n=1 Tax=Micromonospora echinofusca TaxID=47858 RepID=A0ABS3VLY0_MICEH|nr:ATP-binding protein [Micromonospora echinofusca]MBO4205399.1 hypothetical protein [Micromonospora echinofusca]